GPVETGKTHTAKRFCLECKKYASESDRAVDWDVVNCRQRMGDDAVLLRLIQHFDAHFPERGFSIAEKMETLRRHLEKHRLHFIVILDEVDALLKKSGADLIYSFARIAEETIAAKGNISMILISQRSNALEYMDRADLSTFRRSNVVEFPKYDRTELRDIVAGRVLLAIARKSRKKAYITMGDAEDTYAIVCEEFDEKPRAHTQFWKYVRELDALGLVDTKLSGEGVVGKTTLISLPEIPAKVLSDNLERSLKRR